MGGLQWRQILRLLILKGLYLISIKINLNGYVEKKYHFYSSHAGIFLYHSQRINLEQIDVYHSCGLGILSQYSQDLSFNKVRVVPNASKNRILSGHVISLSVL